ncbi:non-ribosomal peptide synthetase [Peribacillus simplex]|uniref:non-ribosomal peptide synthetase n=1 Tax=Peribacillus simplex TaxID=1478 RepID=UPI001627DE34|nr:non-ribosomal peptide synthetase [Peribacillus simplex]
MKMNSLANLFEESVREYGDNIAVRNKDMQFTYKETNILANKMALYIKEKGINKGDNVGIYIEKSEHVLFLIIALLKLGATYVPIDPKSPDERVKHIIKNSELKLLIGDKGRNSGIDCNYVTLDEVIENSNDMAGENFHTLIDPEDPAYIIFTSGSTGKPKGVCVSHENVMNLFLGCDGLFEFNNKDIWTFFHSYAFDFSVWEMWGAWIYGGEVVVVSFEESRNPISFVDLLINTQTTVFNCTPSAFFEVIGELINRQNELSLKYIIFGGEALNFKKLTQWFSPENGRLPKLINMYGITETTVHVTYKEIAKSDVEKGITNIGKVLPHLGFKVMNQNGEDVTGDEEGELYVSGKGVSLGYYKNTMMNKMKFTDIDNVRYYKSGDVVKVLDDGDLQYIARNDEQVQLRGFRIELGEIESSYNDLKNIKNAVVTMDKAFNDDMHLFLYYVADEELAADYLRESVKSSLPAYMIPSFFIKVDNIPLTVNGKLDKSLLPKIVIKDCEAPSNIKSPVDETISEKVRELVVSIIGNGAIKNNQSLLECGMNSLSIMRLIVKIKNQFQIEIAPSVLLENDTIMKLSRVIETRQKEEVKQDYTPININARNTYPLTYEQENLWFIHQTNVDKSLYNIVFSYEISGEVNEGNLELSLDELSNKHQILKSVIREESGMGILAFDESIHHYINYFDVSDIPLDMQEEKINHLVMEETERQFDLGNGPLLSISLVKTNECEHQLLCNIHHIIFDGWSIPLMINDWFSIYEEIENGERNDRDNQSIQYGDYALWQKNSPNYVSGKDNEFWSNEITALRQKSFLQYDHQKTGEGKSTSDIISFLLPKEIQNNLESLHKKTKSTLFMSLLTAYQTFLSVYFDEEEVVVGSPLAKRNHVDTEQLIGYFVNTLPFKLNVSQEDSFEEILRKNIKVIAGVFDHQNLPTKEILKYLSAERTMGNTPLFDTVFVLQNNQKEKLAYRNFTLKPKKINTFKAKFDLVVQAEEMDGDELFISFEFNKSLFNKATIQRMASNFQYWLQEITTEESKKIKDITYLEPAQLRSIIEMGTGNVNQEVEDQRFEDVITKFENIVSTNFSDVAIVHGDDQVTYSELNARANQVAHRLFRNHVNVEDRIGIFMDRSINMVTAILAIMKVGAAYVPLDPSQPESRLKHMIEDSQIKYCLSNEEGLSKYPGDEGKLICIEDILKEREIECEEFVSRKISESDLAYIIYTSGTTGKPKGVMIEHGGLANLCNWHINYYSVDGKDAAVLVSNTSFDASVWEIFPYLTNGNKLVILDYYDLLDVEILSVKLEKEKVTLAFFSTGLLEQLFINDMKFPESIRAILTGGDRLKTIPDHLNFDLYNNYGPTEGTVVSTAYKVLSSDDTVIPIGKPILNAEAYVFNTRIKPTPKGQIGELYIGGKGIARGYINNPEKNVESFIPNPFNSSRKLYKTGDLVKYTEDGNLLFAGRADDQVKIRGYRIELGEISAVLNKCTGIKDCFIAIKDESKAKKFIIAYYISANDLEENYIRDYMKNHLPQYMIPSYFIKMESFPLTVNGKVDMKSLPDTKTNTEGTNNKSANNGTEQKLLKIWKEVLNNQEITIFDNFFECGGDSILSIQICSLAKKENLFITSKNIFEKQSIEELAKVVELTGDLTINQSDVFGKAPFTPIQSWFFTQQINNYNHWNQSVTLKGYPKLNEKLLQKIMAHIVTHHDGLRSRFNKDEAFSKVEKHIDPAENWTMNYVNLSNMNKDKQEREIARLGNDAQQGLNISNGPLMKIECINIGQNEHVIIWIIHHLLVDGVSWRILIEDFDRLYIQDINDQELKLDTKTTSYKEWANNLNQYKNSIPLGIKEYWLNEHKAVNENAIVKTRNVYDGKSFELKLNKEITNKIYNEMTKAYKASIDEIYLSVFATLIGKYFNKKDIHFTLEGHGREELFAGVDLSRTVGWFTTMSPVYIENKETISNTIQGAKKKLRTLPNKGIEYGILTELCGETHMKQNMPIISFNNLGRFHQSNELAAKEVIFFSEQDIQHNSYTEHEVDIELLVVNEEQTIKINYNRHFVREDFERYFQRNLPELFRTLEEETKLVKQMYRPEDFPLLDMPEEELNQLLRKETGIIDIYELTALQKGMLYHSLFDSESSQYKVQLIFDIKGFLDFEKLKNAIVTTSGKHDILKTKLYSSKKGLFYQLLMNSMDPEIEYEEIMDQQVKLEKLLADQYKMIDIENNRLNRFMIVKLTDNEYQLIWTFHHIIMDGWSYSMVINDIFNSYHSITPSSSGSASFKEYVEYMKDYTSNKELREYWAGKLEGARNSGSSITGVLEGEGYIENCYLKVLDEELIDTIQRFCQEYKITMNTFFLTIWLATLKEVKGTENVCCGVVTSGRNIPVRNIEAMVGPFINTVPFIKHISQEKNYIELLDEVQKEFLELSAYENTPLSEIYEWANLENHLFESLYAFENYPMLLANNDEINVSLKEGRETTHYPIVIIITPGSSVQIKFNEAAVNPKLRSSVLSIFNRILSEMLEKMKVK